MKYTLTLSLFFIFGIAQSQSAIRLESVDQISQNTNFYIFTDSYGLTYISSTDGLNIFDSQNTSVYRPSTHNMFGKNIQSQFIEDRENNIWFTTYEALHVFLREKEDFEYFFMHAESGDTLKSEYRIIGLQSCQLWLSAGNEIFIFNICSQTQEKIISIDLSDYYYSILQATDEGYYIYSAGFDKVKVSFVNKNLELEHSYKKEIKGCYAGLSINQNPLWLTVNGALKEMNAKTGEVIEDNKLGKQAFGFLTIDSNRVLISDAQDKLILYDQKRHNVIQEYFLEEENCGNPISDIIMPYIGPDSTIWIGADAKGVFFKNLKKQRFDHWLPPDKNGNTFSVTGILSVPNTTDYLILTRQSGIIKINSSGSILDRYNSLPNGIKNYQALSGAFVNELEILFSSDLTLYLLNINTNRIIELKNSKKSTSYWRNFQYQDATGLIGCNYTNQINRITVSEEQYSITPFSTSNEETIITNFHKDQLGRIFISNNEKSIIILEYDSIKQGYIELTEIPIRGGCRGILNVKDEQSIYLSNSVGLFKINMRNFNFEQLKDQEKNLLQTVYGVFDDAEGNLWLSTNTGIIKYNPKTNQSHQFTKADGVQDMEFNSDAYYKQEDGTIMFGGINGLNVFHPKDINLSKKEAPIHISNYKINDEDNFLAGVPMVLDTMDLTYENNTLSFQFHGIDYGDPDAVRVKYQMEGVDENYVESDEPEVLARYANLPAGSYTFNMIARNSDGAWGKKSRTIAITIHPPFWQTWWFRLLTALGLSALIYYSFRYYYQEQIKRKDLELREKNLIIAKQDALQSERTRIAGEMHDDLGGGLTSIKFLSQKLLRKVDGTENKKQAQKIVHQARDLVNNMSEIIWAMNAGFDSLESLIAYTRRFAFDFLEDYEIELNFKVLGAIENIPFNGEKRRNIFLVMKEALHNSVKHAQATQIDIEFKVDKSIEILIKDNGIGMEVKSSTAGNGIGNMRKRVEAMDGSIVFGGKKGTEILILLPKK